MNAEFAEEARRARGLRGLYWALTFAASWTFVGVLLNLEGSAKLGWLILKEGAIGSAVGVLAAAVMSAKAGKPPQRLENDESVDLQTLAVHLRRTGMLFLTTEAILFEPLSPKHPSVRIPLSEVEGLEPKLAGIPLLTQRWLLTIRHPEGDPRFEILPVFRSVWERALKSKGLEFPQVEA